MDAILIRSYKKKKNLLRDTGSNSDPDNLF